MWPASSTLSGLLPYVLLSLVLTNGACPHLSPIVYPTRGVLKRAGVWYDLPRPVALSRASVVSLAHMLRRFLLCPRRDNDLTGAGPTKMALCSDVCSHVALFKLVALQGDDQLGQALRQAWYVVRQVAIIPRTGLGLTASLSLTGKS